MLIRETEKHHRFTHQYGHELTSKKGSQITLLNDSNRICIVEGFVYAI